MKPLRILLLAAMVVLFYAPAARAFHVPPWDTGHQRGNLVTAEGGSSLSFAYDSGDRKNLAPEPEKIRQRLVTLPSDLYQDFRTTAIG